MKKFFTNHNIRAAIYGALSGTVGISIGKNITLIFHSIGLGFIADVTAMSVIFIALSIIDFSVLKKIKKMNH